MTSLVSNPVRCWGPDHGVKTPAQKGGIKELSLQKQAKKAELLPTCSKEFVAQVELLFGNYLTTARKPDLKRALVVAVLKKKFTEIT